VKHHESRVTITTTPTNTDRSISDALRNRNRNQETILTRAALKQKRTGFKSWNKKWRLRR